MSGCLDLLWGSEPAFLSYKATKSGGQLTEYKGMWRTSAGCGRTVKVGSLVGNLRNIPLLCSPRPKRRFNGFQTSYVN